MADDSNVEMEDENILYDLLINTEWPPETDTQLRGNKEHSSSVIAKAVTGPFRFILHYLWYSPSSSSLPPGLVRLANKQINWQLVQASNGKLLAVVQDQCVEIRSARDDFGSVIGKCQVPKDPSPQWRRVVWSHDCALLAYADSTGTVRVFDLMGSELFVIPPMASFPGDFSYAAAGLIFLEYTASAQWSAELLVITYGGGLKSYLVSVGTNQSFQENHSFSFHAHYSHGITTAIYHPGHRLLLVGGCESGVDDASRATRCGLTAWRALSGSPHYKQVTSYEDDTCTNQKKGFFTVPSFRLFSRHNNEQDGVFRMSLSPDGSLLALIHFSGRLSVWDLPSLRQTVSWDQQLQPGFEEINPEWKTSLEKRKKIKDKEPYYSLCEVAWWSDCVCVCVFSPDKEPYYSLCEVAWWSDCVLILARCSGSLTVSSVRTLQNLLGKSCEWFQPSPRVTAAHDGGFFSLECEVRLAQKRGRLDSNMGGVATEDEEGEEGDSDSDEESSAKARYSGYVKQGLYYVTEMERFAPPRKRPRTVVKSYRLVSLRSTTPEELYQRKIDNEEYGEALSLAQAYSLDSDLVYQRQWRKSTVSIASIQDYLSKIHKRSWVLHECVERVPENVDAAKELLQYGLKGTDLEALIAIGNREDGGRFILSGDLDVDDAPYEDFLSAEKEMELKREKESRKRRELLARVDFSRLTLEQKELCRSRLKLLCYLDRLATYEDILGGPVAAEQRYDSEFFKKFRNQNIILSARTYARESNVQALDILFTYHGAELLQHRLAILFNFPETTSPHEYTILLPEACVDERGNLGVIPWDEQRHREMDWCEEDQCRTVLDQNLPDHAHFLYEDAPDWLRFRMATPPMDLLTDWYLSRAQDIDSCSRQVDCALSLVRLGKERDIPGLERLCDDLVTMETLVYETACELSLTLSDLQQLSDIDKLRLLMKNSSAERYVKDVFQWMVPFLHRCEKQTGGASEALLREYLVTLSLQDLSLPLAVFQHSRPDSQQKVLGDPDQLMTVALECIYSCERDDQLSLCYDILECLPQRGYGPETHITASLHDQVDKLEKHLRTHIKRTYTQRTHIKRTYTQRTHIKRTYNQRTHIKRTYTQRTHIKRTYTQRTHIKRTYTQRTHIKRTYNQRTHAQRTYTQRTHIKRTYTQRTHIKRTYTQRTHIKRTYNQRTHIKRTYTQRTHIKRTYTQRTHIKRTYTQRTHIKRTYNQRTHIKRTYTQRTHIKRTYTQITHIKRTYTQRTHIKRTYTQRTHIKRTYTQRTHIKRTYNQRTHIKRTYTQRTHIKRTYTQRTHIKRTYNQRTHAQRTYTQRTHIKRTYTQRTHIKRTYTQRTHIKRTYNQRTHIKRTYTQRTHIKRTYPQRTHIKRTYTQRTHIKRTYNQRTHAQRTYTQRTHIKRTYNQRTHAQRTYTQRTHIKRTYTQRTHIKRTYNQRTHAQRTYTQRTHIKRTYTQRTHIKRTYTQRTHIKRTYTQRTHIKRTYTQRTHIKRTYTQRTHIKRTYTQTTASPATPRPANTPPNKPWPHII
ncbi:NBAS subunit of NRZ tethering complex [Salvelinus alpinus]